MRRADLAGLAENVESIIEAETNPSMLSGHVTMMVMQNYGSEVCGDYLKHYKSQSHETHLSSERDFGEYMRTRIRTAISYLEDEK